MDNIQFDILPKLALNMIVKNESKIITRLFDSLVGIIDCYCICDTGSTDNTVQLITEYFAARGVPGRVIHEPFKNFEHNRTFALHACKDAANTGDIYADYILLMDADMVLEKGPQFDATQFKLNLGKGDVFHLFQGNDNFSYKNVRIVKNKLSISYWGVTHEVISTPDGTKYDQIERSVAFINDIGDGGAKSDKFVRDIRLLTEGLREKPNNDRYTFYLANSYRDNGEREKAIETYKKRIEIGGWFDEIWQSYYNIGRCYAWSGEHEKAIAYWMLAYDFFPKRLENIYEIMTYYRNQSKHKLVYEFYCMAMRQLEDVDKSKIDYLFLQNDIYDYKIDYEYTISGYYYNPDNIDLGALSMYVMCAKNIDAGILRNVLSNYKFYSDSLPGAAIQIKSPALASDDFNSSTPSMCFHDGSLVTNHRQVNYYINESGGYVNREHIITHNVFTVHYTTNDGSDDVPSVSASFTLDYNREHDARYVGLEDMRLFEHAGTTYFTANRGLPDDTMRVEYGHIDYENKRAVSALLTKPDGQTKIEKNWVLYAAADDHLRVVYKWWPLTTYEIGHANTLVNKCEHKTPRLFESVRGSTNGIRVGAETWFICHVVSYEDRRYYYHILVAINTATGAVTRWSRLFTFEREKVEYVLGFVKTGETEFMLGYSKMDRTTEFKRIDQKELEELFL
jgi:tetratricopeptide (TPR) repeat protein